VNLKQLLTNLEYELLQGDIEVKVSDIVYDSRKATKDNAFVCLSGAVVDGHSYIESAFELGCRVIFVEKDVDLIDGVTYIKLKDTRKALSYLSQALFDYPAKKLTTIALTGTKGKTTTAFMIKEILENAGKKVGVIGTMGVFIGERHIETKNTTPESYDIQYYLNEMVKENIEYAIMEVSSQALKVGRTEGLEFDYAIFTNLSPDHIGGAEHKDMDEYIYCKSLLFKQCRHGVFNIDDECYGNMTKNASCTLNTFGFSQNADIRVKNVEYMVEGGFIGIDFITEGTVNDEFKVNTPGKFTAYNALSAIALSRLLGIDITNIKNALYNFAVRGRVEPVNISDRFTLLIDYAHNAVSMESILTTIREYNPKRIVSMFGCGGNRSKNRRYEMGEISGKLADLTVITEDNSRFEDVMDIIEDIKIGIHKTDGEYVVVPNRKDAIRYCIENAEDGDIILLLGKGHEDYQEINGERFPFDERVIINEIMKEIGEKNGTDN